MEQRQFEIIGGHGAIVWDYTTATAAEAPGSAGGAITTETDATVVVADALRAEIALLKEENERLHVLIKTMRH
jgi:hypothetical protein